MYTAVRARHRSNEYPGRRKLLYAVVLSGPTIAGSVLGLSYLDGVITDSHLTQRSSSVPCKEISGALDTRNVGRFGRLLSFVGSVLLAPHTEQAIVLRPRRQRGWVWIKIRPW